MSENTPVERDEIEKQEADLLPDREAMSVIRDPFQTPGIVPPPIEPSEPA
ncbi:MAG: hypothetical protein QOH95_1186 [Gaiellaceae bacterium]|jgi:hypothetical protein|nr:hypothetical protein [Gaiellaceae bacterium]